MWMHISMGQDTKHRNDLSLPSECEKYVKARKLSQSSIITFDFVIKYLLE
jgi:hypothetical protein